jgi:hypothetical protein
MTTPNRPRARIHNNDAPLPSAETPTDTIVKALAKTAEVTDSTGRKISVRRLSPLDRMRLFAIAGKDLSTNTPWMGMAALAVSCVGIDGEQVAKPASKMQIEALVERLGDEGIEAIGAAYVEIFGVTVEDDENKELEKAKN